MSPLRTVALVLAAQALAACSSSSGGGSSPPDSGQDAESPRDAAEEKGAADGAPTCPSDLPASCPSPTPSYQTDVEPILRSHCVGCHSPSGTAGYYETTYAQVAAQQSAVLDQVYDCLMPPADSLQLTLAQRETLLAWLVCNAPDN